MTKDPGKRSQLVYFSGWLIYWRRNLFGKPVEQNETMTVDYVTSKQNGIVREVIRDYFADKGIDIDELVMLRKADRRGKLEPIFV